MNLQFNIKYFIVFLCVIFFLERTVHSQGVSIGETLTEAHSSAILDLQSDEKGFLLPRMSTLDRNNIISPTLSLMIFNSTTKCLEIFVGTWQKVWCHEPDNEFLCGTSTVRFIYNGAEVTYGTVVGANQRCWLDRNLGALQAATYSTNYLAYGDLFQWGRGADGHQLITWTCGTNNSCGVPVNGSTTTLSNTNQPGHANYILVQNIPPYDWITPQNDNLWQGVSGTNNPCPQDWRLPTSQEWNTERQSWISDNEIGAYASSLKLPMVGYRIYTTVSFYSVGFIAGYWSSTVNGVQVKCLCIGSGGILMNNLNRAYGYSVRCIKD